MLIFTISDETEVQKTGLYPILLQENKPFQGYIKVLKGDIIINELIDLDFLIGTKYFFHRIHQISILHIGQLIADIDRTGILINIFIILGDLKAFLIVIIIDAIWAYLICVIIRKTTSLSERFTFKSRKRSTIERFQ